MAVSSEVNQQFEVSQALDLTLDLLSFHVLFRQDTPSAQGRQ